MVLDVLNLFIKIKAIFVSGGMHGKIIVWNLE
jgi:hypothetical protein